MPCSRDIALHETLAVELGTTSMMNRNEASTRSKNQMNAWKQNVDDDDDGVELCRHTLLTRRSTDPS